MTERWKPEYDETYWIVDTKYNPAVMPVKWVGCRYGHNQYCNGNFFKTRDEAVAAAEKVKALLLSLHEPVTNCNQLPKLTAEVFDRPDCPEWAKYAAVDQDGEGWYYEGKPVVGLSHSFVNITARARKVDGEFDATDWQNSLIERPAELPNWVEIGGYVYDARNGYGKIVSGSVKSCYIEFDGGAGDFVPEAFAELKQARLRPYNAEEIPDLPFEVSKINSNFRTTLVSCQGDNVWLAGATTAISTEELLREFTIKGKICGVLEHLENGEWVE